MKLSFGVKEVLEGKRFTIDDVLKGVSEEEIQETSEWINRLRDVEQHNVLGSLATVLALQEYGNSANPDRPIGFAMVATGSSIDSTDYRDIDLFMVPETFEHGRFMQNLILLGHMSDNLRGRSHPDLLRVLGIENPGRGYNCLFSFRDYGAGRKLGADEAVHGKELQMYLLLDKFDFEFPRHGKHGDIIYHPLLNAEQLIELNKRNGTNLAVLARSYVLESDYSQTLSGLEVNPDDVVDYYRQEIRRMLDGVADADTYLGRLDRLFQQTLDMTGSIRKDSSLTRRRMLMNKAFQLIWEVTDDKVYFDEYVFAFKNYINAKINREVKAAFK